MSAYMTALFLGGNGLRGKFLPAGSLEFVLTLPISRRRIIATRLAVTLAAAFVLETTWLAGQCAVIAATGGRVPVAQLAQTYVLALPVYATWVAASGAIASFLRPLWAVVAATALAVAAFVPTQLLLTSLPLNGRVAWPVLAGMCVVAALALTVTLRYAPRREC